MDLAYGGQGAPIVPLGEKLLFPGFKYWLNLGGIANLSLLADNQWKAYDICECNQLLNALAAERGMEYDKDGKIADVGFVNSDLLSLLNDQEYFKRPAPKSLDNGFSKDVLLPIINRCAISLEDKMRTVVEAYCFANCGGDPEHPESAEMLVTGGER
jgi:anhydro-N-acetylmuramic acid kinase